MALQTPVPQPTPAPALPPSAPAPGPAPTPALPEIRDIAPPVDVFPWPPWMVALAIILILLVLIIIAWLIVRALRNRPAPPPPTPRTIALRELEALRSEVTLLDPYAFSVRVSDVLRGYIEAQFGLRAKEQTSPEFLACLSGAAQFGGDDRALLARFLEKCDLIKFARIDATSEDSAALLASAMAFVQGGRA